MRLDGLRFRCRCYVFVPIVVLVGCPEGARVLDSEGYGVAVVVVCHCLQAKNCLWWLMRIIFVDGKRSTRSKTILHIGSIGLCRREWGGTMGWKLLCSKVIAIKNL